jgi:redox-sensitive bicupin YhaK (pirin superfamily)
MERRNFIKNSVLGGFLLGSLSSFTKVFGAGKQSPYRGVESVLSPSRTHMVGNGFKVMNFYPNGRGIEERMSPFFLLDFNAEVNYPPSDISRGVGVHPHRGIETITIAYKGSVAHHDSAGNAGVINPGDVQWMTAGGGVLHKEYHEEDYRKKGGAFEMIQLWINLPKKYKMTPAKYQSILHKEKGKVALPQNAGTVHVIAGEYNGVKGPAQAFSPVHLYDIHLNPQGEVKFTLPAGYNTGMLVVDGDIVVNGFHKVPENHYVQLKNEGGTIHLKANQKKTIVLVMSGEPLNEPYVSYGPFVMNTEEEIRQAIKDYNAGRFGFLAD